MKQVDVYFDPDDPSFNYTIKSMRNTLRQRYRDSESPVIDKNFSWRVIRTCFSTAKRKEFHLLYSDG